MSETSLKKLFFFKQVRILFVWILFCLIITSYLGQKTPKLIYDLSANYSNGPLFEQTLKHLLFLLLGIFFSRIIYQVMINKYVKLIIQHIRAKCYGKWLHSYDLIENHDNSTREQFPLGEVIARIMSDTQSFRELMTSGTLGILINLVYVISCLIGFITLDLYVGSVIGLAQILATIALIYGSKYMRDIFHRVRQSRGMVSRQIANVTGGLADLYPIQHGNYASKTGEIVYSDFMRKQIKANVWDAGYYSVAESLFPVFLILVMLIAPHSKIVGAALIFAIIDLIQRSIEPIKSIAGKITNIQRAATGIERIREFYFEISKKSSSIDYKKKGPIERIQHLKLDLKSFQYPNLKQDTERKPFRLEDISFEVDPGQLIGLVGLSGCGKSTLLKILAGNIIPDHGEVLIKSGDRNTISFPKDSTFYREHVSLISQDSHVFSTTLRFNITLGDESHDFDQFWSWVVEELPYLKSWGIGPETIIDLKKLSSGQKQLLSALRACFLKKEIVCFDEISSALDSGLELALRRIVQLIQKNSITFIVAHRIETIIEANNIVVLDQGRCVEQGQHQELLKKSKVYQNFIAELSQSIS